MSIVSRSSACLALAAGLVTCLAVRAPMARVDRLVLTAILFVAYAALFLLVEGFVRLVSARLARARGREARLPRPLWSMWMLAGLFMTNQLAAGFGYKDAVYAEPPWLSAAGPAPQAAILLAGWAALLGLCWLAQGWLQARPGRGRRAAGVALLASSLLVLAPSAGDDPRAAHAAGPKSALPPPGPRLPRPLVVLGLDGVDPDLLRSAVGTGRLPHFAHLLSEGYAGTLDNHGYGYSPVVWTTLVTGLPKERHQIYDFATTTSPLFVRPLNPWLAQVPAGFAVKSIVNRILAPAGLVGQRLTDGRDRRGPSIWQILSAHGYRSLVVNYMTSFPAERIEGAFLASNVYHAALDAAREGEAALAGYEFPPGVASRSPARALVAPAPHSPLGKAEREFDYLSDLTLGLLETESYDLVTFYTPWPDAFNHGLSVPQYRAMRAGRFEDGLPRQFLSAYERIDAFVGQVRAALPGGNLLVVSDHGVGTGFRRHETVLQHAHHAHGILLAAGPDVRPGAAGAAMSMYDATPTLLAYFGLPLAADMPGSPSGELFAGLPRVARTASYMSLVANDRVEEFSAGDQESVKERLRALGYIQ